MSLYNLPYDTISKVITAIAREQGLTFVERGIHNNRYATRCPWHELEGKKRLSFSVNAESNTWNCHYGCGKGGILNAVILLHPRVGMDRYSAISWLTEKGLIPPSDAAFAPSEKDDLEETLRRLCTKDGKTWPSTATVRNKAREIVAQRFRKFPTHEPVSWDEPAEPWVAHDPDWLAAREMVLHGIGSQLQMTIDELHERAPLEPRLQQYLLVRIDEEYHRPGVEGFPITMPVAQAMARLVRREIAAEPIDVYVWSHAACIVRPDDPANVPSWFNPTGTAPAKRYLRYVELLEMLAESERRTWQEMERKLHELPELQSALLPWIEARAAGAAA